MVIPHLTLVGFGNICLPAPMTGAGSVTQNLACPLCPPRSDNRLRIYRHRGSTLMRPDNVRETAGVIVKSGVWSLSGVPVCLIGKLFSILELYVVYDKMQFYETSEYRPAVLCVVDQFVVY